MSSSPRVSQLIAQAASARDAPKKFWAHRPDVTLMDLRLPEMSGIDTTIAIRAEFPEARIIMLTRFEGDMKIQRAWGGRNSRVPAEEYAPKIWPRQSARSYQVM